MNDPAPSVPPWQADSVVPPEFKILEQLGEGAYGCVYKAIHSSLDTKVAIKFIRKDLFSDEAAIFSYFKKEVKAVSRLDHPNIVKVLQVGRCTDDTAFLVYELLEGKTLKEHLEKEGTLSAQVLAQLSTQLLAALEHAHKNGVIHRDIKPGNIMLLAEQSNSSFFHVKLLDFGLARTETSPGSTSQTSSSNTAQAGTPSYMSPEQCKGESVTIQTDFYSLACVLYECLLGQTPFSADSPMHMRYKHINETAPLPDKRLSKELNSFFSKCLSKTPEQRPANSKDFERALVAGLKSQERFRQEPAQIKNRGKIAIAIVLILTILPVTIWLIKTKNKEHSPTQKQTKNQDSILKGASTITQIKHLRENLEDGCFINQKNMTAALKDLEENLIPAAQKNKALYFAAIVSKAHVLQVLNRRQESIASYQNAANLCLIKDSIYAPESCQCFSKIAKQYMELNDRNNAEAYAKLALSNYKKYEAGETKSLTEGTLNCLELSPVREVCYLVLAKIAYQKKDYKTAQIYCKESISALDARRELNSGQDAAVFLADIYMSQGKRKEAYAEIEKVLDLCEQLLEGPEAKTRVELAKEETRTILLCAHWYLNNGNIDLAKQSYKKVISISQLYKLGMNQTTAIAETALSNIKKAGQ